MLELIIIISLFNTTLIHCLKKWGALDMYSAYRYLWMPKADCYLCLGFWVTVIDATIPHFIIYRNWQIVFLPFCAATLINYFINIALVNDYDQNK